MPSMDVIEIKAFIPAQDFDLSLRFYQDLGFTLSYRDDEVAYLHHGESAFLLQNFHVEALAKNFMMHLLVKDVDAWHDHVTQADLGGRYGVTVGEVELQPWRMRDFALTDPAGVLWRIAQNV